MKVIKMLSEMIADELEGAENYITEALKFKDDHPGLADVLYEISTQEMRHVNMLHEQVSAIIKKHREAHGDPPAAMMAIYEWEHGKQIDKAKEVKILQSHYRDGA
jgi:Mn-containing catalase